MRGLLRPLRMAWRRLTAMRTALVLLLSPALAPFVPAAYASLLAKLCATGVGLGWNFLGNHFWTFRMTGERGPL